jgi:hypothetical protein
MSLNRQGIVLNAMMLAALMAVIAGAARRFAPLWQPGYLVAACFLVALEAGIVHTIFRVERMGLAELAYYLVPELVVMLVFMRIAATLSLGVATLAADSEGWLFDPMSIFDPLYLSFIAAGVFVGCLAHVGMRDLAEIAPKPFERQAPQDEGHKSYTLAVSADRALALRRISSRFVGGGALLLLALGVEAVNIERITGPSRPISALSGGAALLYLVSGFMLYSQARLELLQARWRLEGMVVAANVTRRWGRASWALIGGVAGAALLLPRAYGLGLLDTLRALLGLIGYALAIVGYMVLWFLSLVALIPALLLSLLAPSEQTGPTQLPRFEPPYLPPAGAQEPHLLPALIFWACMSVLVCYALWIIVQRHSGLLSALTTWKPVAWLRRRLGWLWRDSYAWATLASQRVRTLLQRPVVLPQPRIPPLRLRRLSPRELVLYFYRSTAQRAAARGLRRGAAQTPYEYQATLAQHLPDVDQEIGELTEAFLLAQYSARPVGSADARQARQPWERVRRRLRMLRDDQRIEDRG